MSSLSERLKELRLSSGYSLQDLADRSNTSKSAINMYERGERRPKYEVLVSIANVFDVDVDYLLCKTDNPRKRGLRIGTRINSNIANNIQHHREQKGLSQKQFADLLGVDEDAVNALESGLYDLDKEMLYKICDVLYLIPGNIVPRDTDELTEDEEYLLSRRKQTSPDTPELTEGEQELLDMYRRASDNQKQMVLEIIRVALKMKE